MRYWSLLAAKLALIAGVLYYGWWGATMLLPPPRMIYRGSFFGHDLAWTLVAGVFFLVGCGLLYLAAWDQKYRCRVCARRVRMPITSGSWGRMLQLGRPRVEYICPYGHGTLKVSELQISGLEAADWKANDDMWKELVSLEDDHK